MSDLTNMEKRKFENLLRMSSGYVLGFSNRSLDEFVLDSIGRSIYDQRYSLGSGSLPPRRAIHAHIKTRRQQGLEAAAQQAHLPRQKKGALAKDTDLLHLG